jgi:hypothetical protein
MVKSPGWGGPFVTTVTEAKDCTEAALQVKVKVRLSRSGRELAAIKMSTLIDWEDVELREVLYGVNAILSKLRLASLSDHTAVPEPTKSTTPDRNRFWLTFIFIASTDVMATIGADAPNTTTVVVRVANRTAAACCPSDTCRVTSDAVSAEDCGAELESTEACTVEGSSNTLQSALNVG